MKDFLANSILTILAVGLFVAAMFLTGIYFIFIFPFQWALNHGTTDKQRAGYDLW